MESWLMTEINAETLRHLCKETGGYQLPHLNDQLMLHCKGFNKIQNLEEYLNVRCLWLQENAISKIEGLEKLVELRTLYLQQNCITRIENLSHLEHLSTLNLSHNWITKLEGLSALVNLETLLLQNCRLPSLASIEELTKLPKLESVDVAHNKIDLQGDETPEDYLEFWKRLPKATCMYLQGNDVQNKLRHYRKKMICNLPDLQYLDDRPVFDNERRLAIAWGRGGFEEEARERTLMNQEKAQQMKDDMQKWKEMQNKGAPLKAQREKEWDLVLAQKKIDDEKYRREKIEKQNELIMVETRARDPIEVEEYRATTQLMQMRDKLLNLHRQHILDQEMLGERETKDRQEIVALRSEGMSGMQESLQEALHGKKEPEEPVEDLRSMLEDAAAADPAKEIQAMMDAMKKDRSKELKQHMDDISKAETEFPELSAITMEDLPTKMAWSIEGARAPVKESPKANGNNKLWNFYKQTESKRMYGDK